MKKWIVHRYRAAKAWTRRQYLRFKKWVIGILVSIGVIAPPLLYAEIIDFTYTAPTTYTDGSPLPAAEIQFSRLYCDGSMVVEEPGADQDFSTDLGIGSHDCYATIVDIYDRESDPSNVVTVVVSPPGTGPSPPVLNQP